MNRRSIRWLAGAACCLAALGGARGDGLPGYTTGIPMPIGMNDTADPAKNAWFASNNVFVANGGFVSPTDATTYVSPPATGADKPRYSLGHAVVGAAWEISKPQYYLADKIDAPDDVDWDATYEAYLASGGAAATSGFIFCNDPETRGVYASSGGTHAFDWVLTNGETRHATYAFASACQGRPKRIFWTDYPYNGEKISLIGKFVKFFGASNLVEPKTGTVTNRSGGVVAEQKNAIVSGLYLDPSSMSLEARGTEVGQVVMAYYADGNYTKILHVQTIEVCQPETIFNDGTIGEPLEPNGRGYDGDGLTAIVRAGVGDVLDGRGDYLYQHAGEHNYSPHNGDVYPIRPTEGQRWKAEVCWMEEDAMKVRWPFEIDQYECVWPDDAPIFVRGDLDGDDGAALAIPTTYVATLMTYQEPEGHAREVAADGSFTTDLNGFDALEGWSLLKLEADDDVWFLPVKSVTRSNPAHYTLSPIPIDVGREARLDAVPRAALASGARFAATPDEPGYVYQPGTPEGNYDLNVYDETNAASAVYPISAGGDVEVWWRARVTRDDMPEPVVVPTLPAVYRPAWPAADAAPQIVLASQEGSGNETLYGHHGAATFDSTNATLAMPSRVYFPNGKGTFAFWTRLRDGACAAAADGAAAFLRLGGDDDRSLGLRINAAKKLEMLSGADAIATGEDEFRPAFATNWVHFALVVDDGTATLHVDGAPILSGTLSDGAFLAGILTPAFGPGAAVGRQIAEVVAFRRALSADEIADERHATREGAETDVSGYWSFRPDEDLVASVQTHGDGEDVRAFLNRADNGASWSTATDVILSLPGAPLKGSCVISSESEPTVYRQPDPAARGYNPNEEHAFVEAGRGGYVVWALRCDLGEEGAPQGVFAEYLKDGRNAVQFCHVVATNADWPTLGCACTAGYALPGPIPLTTRIDPWLAADKWTGTDAVYRDRKTQLWCRAGDREFDFFKHYRQQETFDWPTLSAPPAVGTAVPWLSALGTTARDAATLLDGDPAPWRFRSAWPATATTMKIGQTLTTAEDGLPEVWGAKSVSVIYPAPGEGENVVMLSDPTVKQSVALDAETFKKTGLSTDPNGGLVQRKGMYYFTEASPFLSSRFHYDPTTETLCLTGDRAEQNAGATVLYPNVLSSAERQAAEELVASDAEGRDAWVAAVDQLATEPVEPNTVAFETANDATELKTTYKAVDHYALTALGGTNWVVLIENDASDDQMATVDGVRQACPVADGDPVNLHVFRVVPQYHLARVVTREDENNLLSQQLSVLYTDPIGGKADDFEFAWAWHLPESDGTVPVDFGAYVERPAETARGESPYGLTRFVVGQQGDTLANMVNRYWSCRYRAKEGTVARETMGEAWSDWCNPPGLAEGWVQRVLNNVTPFNQRMTDLENNEAETAVTMLQQAGGPYTGDVALNQDNLAEVGLVQLYETILNKAESMSLMLGVNDAAANQQLLQAVERLHDLYKILGDEAYTDAKDPTVAYGNNISTLENEPGVDFGSLSTSLFCFDNQVSSLLDEELCLLRGRTGVSAPTCRIGPYYNRLVWNFTKGITAGEVAYVVNYDVNGGETLAMSEEQAAQAYPQGHGDAYGHYLSALKGWYRLLRNPNFTWGAPVQGEINVADAAVNVDYSEEAKFAKAAADVAKTAADVVDLTARAAWRDAAASEAMPGYLDVNATNAFGYGEWASRGGYGALVNWVVANSLLPIDRTLDEANAGDGDYADAGLTRIDRGNTSELVDVCDSAAAILAAVDRVDGGENPLGLSDHAIPFDLEPSGVSDGSNSHYEQIRDRAKTALANARKILAYAQEQGNHMRKLTEMADTWAGDIECEELDYTDELIGYYGTPYTDDIGPGKTYEQGYEGPDVLHYGWMDLSLYGISDSEISDTVTVLKIYSGSDLKKIGDYAEVQQFMDESCTTCAVPCLVTRTGLTRKPDSIGGYRVSPGSIQEKYGEFLEQYVKVQGSKGAITSAEVNYQNTLSRTEALAARYTALYAIKQSLALVKAAFSANEFVDSLAANTASAVSKVEEAASSVARSAAMLVSGIGTTAVVSPRSVVEAAQAAETVVKTTSEATAEAARENKYSALKYAVTVAEEALSAAEATIEQDDKVRDLMLTLREAAGNVVSAYKSHLLELIALNNLSDSVAKEIAAAERVLDKRTLARQQYVDQYNQMRYNEMFFRLARDRALTRYTAAFDLAQKYAYLAAQAYDYETGLMRSNDGSRDDFKAKIVTTRALGAFDEDGEPIVADDGDLGLAGYLAQMDANWLVLKPRLGINNPQPYATWFSLRSELFRILPGEDGDANWAKELKKHWVDDIRETEVYRRHCQKFQSRYGLKDKEPGLVIPFSTTIDFAKNLFGNDLAGGDHSYDSTWYATKIAAAGVWFEGYGEKTDAAGSSAQSALSLTPTVYLVPAGHDCLRAPGQDDGKFWQFSVVDQVIPAPYDIGSYELDDDAYFPSMNDADWGEGSLSAKIRRHPAFRAYYGGEGVFPDDNGLDATRLVGRSVWNDQWYLVIPAGSMNADRDKALSAFVNGLDENRDGNLDFKPVLDIKIGFRTYSNSGN